MAEEKREAETEKESVEDFTEQMGRGKEPWQRELMGVDKQWDALAKLESLGCKLESVSADHVLTFSQHGREFSMPESNLTTFTPPDRKEMSPRQQRANHYDANIQKTINSLIEAKAYADTQPYSDAQKNSIYGEIASHLGLETHPGQWGPFVRPEYADPAQVTALMYASLESHAPIAVAQWTAEQTEMFPTSMDGASMETVILAVQEGMPMQIAKTLVQEQEFLDRDTFSAFRFFNNQLSAESLDLLVQKTVGRDIYNLDSITGEINSAGYMLRRMEALDAGMSKAGKEELLQTALGVDKNLREWLCDDLYRVFDQGQSKALISYLPSMTTTEALSNVLDRAERNFNEREKARQAEQVAEADAKNRKGFFGRMADTVRNAAQTIANLSRQETEAVTSSLENKEAQRKLNNEIGRLETLGFVLTSEQRTMLEEFTSIYVDACGLNENALRSAAMNIAQGCDREKLTWLGESYLKAERMEQAFGWNLSPEEETAMAECLAQAATPGAVYVMCGGEQPTLEQMKEITGKTEVEFITEMHPDLAKAVNAWNDILSGKAAETPEAMHEKAEEGNKRVAFAKECISSAEDITPEASEFLTQLALMPDMTKEQISAAYSLTTLGEYSVDEVKEMLGYENGYPPDTFRDISSPEAFSELFRHGTQLDEQEIFRAFEAGEQEPYEFSEAEENMDEWNEPKPEAEGRRTDNRNFNTGDGTVGGEEEEEEEEEW